MATMVAMPVGVPASAPTSGPMELPTFPEYDLKIKMKDKKGQYSKLLFQLAAVPGQETKVFGMTLEDYIEALVGFYDNEAPIREAVLKAWRACPGETAPAEFAPEATYYIPAHVCLLALEDSHETFEILRSRNSTLFTIVGFLRLKGHCRNKSFETSAFTPIADRVEAVFTSWLKSQGVVPPKFDEIERVLMQEGGEIVWHIAALYKRADGTPIGSVPTLGK